jgi:hypothetical protein
MIEVSEWKAGNADLKVIFIVKAGKCGLKGGFFEGKYVSCCKEFECKRVF